MRTYSSWVPELSRLFIETSNSSISSCCASAGNRWSPLFLVEQPWRGNELQVMKLDHCLLIFLGDGQSVLTTRKCRLSRISERKRACANEKAQFQPSGYSQQMEGAGTGQDKCGSANLDGLAQFDTSAGRVGDTCIGVETGSRSRNQSLGKKHQRLVAAQRFHDQGGLKPVAATDAGRV